MTTKSAYQSKPKVLAEKGITTYLLYKLSACTGGQTSVNRFQGSLARYPITDASQMAQYIVFDTNHFNWFVHNFLNYVPQMGSISSEDVLEFIRDVRNSIVGVYEALPDNQSNLRNALKEHVSTFDTCFERNVNWDVSHLMRQAKTLVSNSSYYANIVRVSNPITSISQENLLGFVYDKALLYFEAIMRLVRKSEWAFTDLSRISPELPSGWYHEGNYILYDESMREMVPGESESTGVSWGHRQESPPNNSAYTLPFHPELIRETAHLVEKE